MAGDRKDVSFIVRAQDAATGVLKQVENALHHTVSEIFSFKDVLKLATGALAGLKLADLITDIVDLGAACDKTFRTIAANLPTFTEGIAELKENIDQLGQVSGRALDELEGAAVKIAQAGVSSADELNQVLQAATTLADATGTSVEENAQLLIQMRREFKLTGDEALSTAAKLASVTQGKIGITELLSAFQAATPIFLKFGIDTDTGTRALAALVDQGRTTSRSIREELGKLDAEGIHEYANQIHVAADAEEQLAQRADHVRDSIEAANQKIKNEFEQTLEDVGVSITTNVVRPLEAATTALLRLTREGNWSALIEIGHGNPFGALAEVNRANRNTVDDGRNHGSSETIDTGAASTQPHVTTVAEKKALEDAAKAAAAVNAEFEKLSQTTSEATPKSQQFAQAIAEWAKKGLEATDNLDTFNAQLDTLQGILAKLRNDEALEKQAKDAKESAEAWRMLDQAFAKISGNAIDEFDQQVKDLFANLKEAESSFKGEALDKYKAKVAELSAKYAELRKKVVDADAVQKLLNDDLDKLAGMKKWLDSISQSEKDEADAKKHVQELAQSWDQVGRSVIAAAQAVGGLDDTTAAALQNMVTLGHGILDLFSSNIGAGIAETVSSLGALMKSSSALAKRVEDDWKGVLATIAGLASPLSQARTGNDLAARQADVQQQFATARQQVETNFAGKMLEGPREQFLKQLNDLEAQRLDLLKQQYAQEQQQLQEDYHIRLLRAEGFTTEADAEALAIQQQREMADAIANGASEATQAALAAAQHAEALKAEADAAHAAAKASLDAAVGKANNDIQIDNITDPTSVFARKAQAYKSAGGALGGILGGVDLDHLSGDDIAKLNDQFRELFHQLEDPNNTVDTAGLSIEDLEAALLDLHSAADAVADAVQSAADAFNDATSNLSLVERIFGTTPSKHAVDLAGAAGIDLSQFDLTKQAGHDAAIKFIQDLATANPTMMSIYAAIADAINAVPIIDGSGGASLGGSANGSASAAGYQSLTTIQGDRMLDYDLRQLNVLTHMDQTLSTVAGRLTAPALPVASIGGFTSSSSSGARAGGAGIGALVNTVNIHVTSSSDDAAAQGREMARSFAREIDIEFGRSATLRKVMRGDISIAGGG